MLEKDFKEIGCIVIPKNSNREEFINYCFNKERFWVMTNTRGMLANVPCIHQVISDIKFPIDDTSLGTQVMVEYISSYQQFIITGTLSKIGCSSYNNEESLLIRKTYEGIDKEAFGNSIGIIGNSFLSKLNLFCKNVCKKAAQLYIDCFGDENSKLELRSSGWVFVKSESGIKLRYKSEKEITILEDKLEILFQKDQKLTFSDKKLEYTDGTNSFVIDDSGYNFGNINFKDYITEILDFLGNDIILLTSMGPTSKGCASSPSGAQLNQLKQKLENINQ